MTDMIPAEAVEAAAKMRLMIDDALRIHAPYGTRVGKGLAWVDPRCQECETRWPCKTTRALTSQVSGHLATSGPA